MSGTSLGSFDSPLFVSLSQERWCNTDRTKAREQTKTIDTCSFNISSHPVAEADDLASNFCHCRCAFYLQICDLKILKSHLRNLREWGQVCGHSESRLLLWACHMCSSLTFLGKTSHMSTAQGSFFHHQRWGWCKVSEGLVIAL